MREKKINWRNRTGLAFYDNLLDSPEYYQKEKALTGKIVQMSPDKYFNKVREIFNNHPYACFTANDLVYKYVKLMKAGNKFDIAILDYDLGVQEGRHRAQAVKELKIDKMPVLVVERI